jgi:hypothetical protein
MHYLNDNTYAPAITPYIENYLRNKLISMDLDLPAGVVKPQVRNTYDGFNYGGSDYCNPYASVSVPNPTITNEMDPSPPVAFGLRAILSESDNPTYTSCYLTYNYGATFESFASNGHTAAASADAATNYAAPQTISTESTSATIAYNAWLGVSQTTGPNGEQLQLSYDTAGRPFGLDNRNHARGHIGVSCDRPERRRTRQDRAGWIHAGHAGRCGQNHPNGARDERVSHSVCGRYGLRAVRLFAAG